MGRNQTKATKSSKQTASSKGVSEKTAKKVTIVEAENTISQGVRKFEEEDVKEVLDKTDEIKKKFEIRGPLGRLIEDLKLLISFLKDYWPGQYHQVPFWTISAILFALLYVLDPMDLIPDFILGVGLLDDATVMAACLAMIQRDFNKYKEWKTRHSA